MVRQFLVLCVLAALISGCGSGGVPSDASPGVGKEAAAGSPGKVRVAFVTNNASDFWKIAEAGTKKAAEELGCEVLFRIPSKGTAEEQQSIVQDLIVTGVSGIAISPKDPQNQTEMLNEAAAKVNLITQDSDAPESNRICYIGTNNYDAGRAAGELIKKALPEGGRIMLFVGTLDAQNAQDRKRGIEDVLKGTNIEIIGVRTDETDRSKAIANVQDTLVTYPDVACLVGLWSYNGPAILNGVRDSRKLGQVKIVCFDEEEETLQGVKDGHIFGTIVQQPFEFGYESVRLLVDLAKGDKSRIPPNKAIYIDVLTVTRENVDEFWTRLKQLTGRT
ncbi:MAG TPA: sugar-binding protein [Candidatus Hydrogenedentes bacterium]|nr:sugar-binding protein [Candidatus Hydrogenedentota bacterium]HOL76698.1 sugar-binding protein [Candidatus Hydrogenedentota bacterium]HPO85341.1 sugar-binding protein [Candidatus Hydrogenedentota bacterium]